jgi:RNA polymerase sigma-70 factor (ECF subfamily)
MPVNSNQSPDERFFRLYAVNEVALHTFVRSLLPTRQDADEVMQEVMVALWQGCGNATEFRPWAFGVARNLALVHLRKKSRDRLVFDEELVNRLADLSVQDEAVHAAQRDALEGCMQKLPPAQRELVLLAYAKGVRIDRLAQLRGQTPMSLYKMLHRIRQGLLECVQRTLAIEDSV